VALLMISYDILKPDATGTDYAPLIEGLKKIGAKKILSAQWIVQSNSTEKEIFDYCWQFRCSPEDRFLVVKVPAWYGTQDAFLSPMPTSY